jgi:tetratricopeptide (TPR) repeat protein
MESLFLVASLVVFVSGLQLFSWYFGLGITQDTKIGWISVIGADRSFPLVPIRLWWAMGVSTWLAAYSAQVIPLTAVWGFTVRRSDYRFVLRLLAVLLTMVLTLTFSRGGILALAFSVGVLVVLRMLRTRSNEQFFTKRRLAALGIIFTMGVAALVVVSQLSRTEGRASGDVRRLDMWESALRMTVSEIPLGVGPGLFGRTYRDYRDPSIADDRMGAAHNLYLNTAAEVGFAGAAIIIWLGVAFGRAWWNQWQKASAGQKFRLEAMLAALLGLGFQSVFDVFVATPVVLPALVMIAYSGTKKGTILQPNVQVTSRWPAFAALLISLGYGAAFVQIDRAHLQHQNSLRGDEDALVAAQNAVSLDPSLRLYPLQVAYLSAKQLLECPQADLDAAAQFYQDALQIEPTWDTGWINLASIEAKQGNITAALDHLDRAWRINNVNTALLHWARLAEANDSASDEEILIAYMNTISISPTLPLSEFWWATSLRREAVERYLLGIPIDWQYRILSVHDAEAANALVLSKPQTAAEWWILGEYTLNLEKSPEQAVTMFSEAIERERTNGDYYVSRARAEIQIDPIAARRDLDIALLLGTRHEYPNAVAVALAQNPNEIFELRASALPPQVVQQNFEGVLYAGRVANFTILPDMRWPGPGRNAMQPWYDIAEAYLSEGKTEDAANVYRVILDYAPEETLACQQRETLEPNMAECECGLHLIGCDMR